MIECEELAKTRARVSAYDEVKPVNLEEVIINKEKLDHDGKYHRRDYDNIIPREKRNFINA